MLKPAEKRSKTIEGLKKFNTNFNKMDILLNEPEKEKWATFDTSTFPVVKVKMNKEIKSDAEFQGFLDDWEKLYERNEKFVLFFDTTDVGFVSMKYAIRMRSFVRKLKKEYPENLERSLIKVDSSWVKFLLRIIFTFERPVADVYVHSDNEEVVNFNIENNKKLIGVTRYRK